MQPQTHKHLWTQSRACKSDVEWWYQVYIRLCVTGHRPSDILGNSLSLSLCLPPSLPFSNSPFILFFPRSSTTPAAQERRDPRYLASLSLHTETSSSFSSPPSLDRLPIIRSKEHPALPANEKNHGEGGGGGGGESILSCRSLFSPRFFNWNVVRGV